MVKGVHNQKRELSKQEANHKVDIHLFSMLLSQAMHMDWIRQYCDLSQRLLPFYIQKDLWWQGLQNLSYSWGKDPKEARWKSTQQGAKQQRATVPPRHHATSVMRRAHFTGNCNSFQILSLCYGTARKKRLCFQCSEVHPRSSCIVLACKCGKQHHQLLC